MEGGEDEEPQGGRLQLSSAFVKLKYGPQGSPIALKLS